MAFCPATLKPCIDDLCYNGGCMNPLAYGESLLVPCVGCGKLITMEGPNDDDCDCDPWEDEFDDEPEDD